MANRERTLDTGGTSEFDEELDSVTKLETITDLADIEGLQDRLPDGWTAKPDMVQFKGEGLEETLLIRRSADDPQLVLKPVEMTDPAGEIEFYQRQHSTDARTLRLTAESLDEAVRAAVNWVHQRAR